MWPLIAVACAACAVSRPAAAPAARPAAVGASPIATASPVEVAPGGTRLLASDPAGVAPGTEAPGPAEVAAQVGAPGEAEVDPEGPRGVAGVYAPAVASCASGVALVGGIGGSCALDAALGLGVWTGERWTFLGGDRFAEDGPPEPAARSHAAMAWDGRRQRLVLFGGYVGPEVGADTWESDGTSWTPHAGVDGPAPRASTAMAHDAARGVVLLFGGRAGGAGSEARLLDDTWSWDGARWTRHVTPVAPRARFEHAMAYDADRQQVVLFGGRPGTYDGEALDDTWVWDGRGWAPCDPPRSPVARCRHAMAYDARRQRVVVHGGVHLNPHDSALLGDLWEWDGATWRRARAPLEPPRRELHGLAWDPVRERLLCVGGRGERRFDDTWSWDGAAWTQVGGQDWTRCTRPEEPPRRPPRPRGLRSRHERVPGQPSAQAVAALRRLATRSLADWSSELARAPRELQVEVGLELEARAIDSYADLHDGDRREVALGLVDHVQLTVGLKAEELWTFQRLWVGTFGGLPRLPRDPTRPWHWRPAQVAALLRLRRDPRVHAVAPSELVQRIEDARWRRAAEPAWRDEWLAALRDPAAPADQLLPRQALLFLLEEPAEVRSLQGLLESPLVADRALAHLVAAAAIPDLKLQPPAELERAVWWAGGLLEAPPAVELEALDARLAAWLAENAGRLALDPTTGRYALR